MSDQSVGRIEQLTHTPGPWKPEFREKTLAVYQRTRSGAKTGRPVCAVARKDIGNANLIAAAPTLLDACKLVALYFERNSASGNFQCDDEHEAWSAVRAAIAKAESRS